METNLPNIGFLEVVAVFASTGAEVPISLLVGGVWLSGFTVSERVFLEQATGLFAGWSEATAETPETEEQLREGPFKHLFARMQDDLSVPSAIFLRDVTAWIGVAHANLGLPFMKVEIGSVGAVQLGRMEPGK